MYAFPYLSRTIGTEMFARLLAMMPPPLDASPEALRDRDVVAMCMLKQMGPIGSAEEASLAITVVAADAHAHDALRGAVENAGDFKRVMQCRAQANAMMRTRHKAAAELEALMRGRMAAERLAEQDDQPQPAAAVETQGEVERTVIERGGAEPAGVDAAAVDRPNKSSVIVSFPRPAPAMVVPGMGPSAVGRAGWRAMSHNVIHYPAM